MWVLEYLQALWDIINRSFTFGGDFVKVNITFQFQLVYIYMAQGLMGGLVYVVANGLMVRKRLSFMKC